MKKKAVGEGKFKESLREVMGKNRKTQQSWDNGREIYELNAVGKSIISTCKAFGKGNLKMVLRRSAMRERGRHDAGSRLFGGGRYLGEAMRKQLYSKKRGGRQWGGGENRNFQRSMGVVNPFSSKEEKMFEKRKGVRFLGTTTEKSSFYKFRGGAQMGKSRPKNAHRYHREVIVRKRWLRKVYSKKTI